MTVVSLNKVRKARAKGEAQAQAAANRVKFGQSAPEKAQARAEAEKARRLLDNARRET